MRTTPALALLAAFLASSAVGVLASPQEHGGKTCKLSGKGHHKHNHHKHRHLDEIASPVPVSGSGAIPAINSGSSDGAQAPVAGPGADFAVAPRSALVTPPAGLEGVTSDSGARKMHKKKKQKGKCVLKHNAEDQGLAPGQGALQEREMPDVTGAPDGDGSGRQSQPDQVPSGASAQPGAQPSVGDQGQAGPQGQPQGPQGYGPSLSQGNNGSTGQGDTGSPGDGQNQGQGHEDYGPSAGQSSPGSPAQGDVGNPSLGNSQGQEGYAPSNGQGSPGSQGQGQGQGSTKSPVGYQPSQAPAGNATDGVHCKGIPGSTTLPHNSNIKYDWFNPAFVHHGPGTTFGGGDNFWQGGACMLDSLPHKNLPSVAMDQTFFQNGLACGTCVEIGPTSASQFSNNIKWSVEQPIKGALPPGKKTIAVVSDLCPGVEQCMSGLDMHPDAWNSVTSGANGSKHPINWKFVNCKEAFETSGSGGASLQVHWREGANPGFFQVQIRGSHEAVVRVEMKMAGNTWREGKSTDASWWAWQASDTAGCGEATKVFFRVTDWQGQTITSELPTTMGKDLFMEANFDAVGRSSDA